MMRSDYALSSIGVAFNISQAKQYSPEEAILLTVSDSNFPQDKKGMGLLILWIKHYGKYIHMERLKNMTKDISDQDLAILKGLALKFKKSDHRWESIIKKTRKVTGLVKDSELLMKIKGVDLDFKVFGVLTAPITEDHEKKLLVEKSVLANNIWMLNRLKYGTNLRADMVTIRGFKKVKTAYRASKELYCSLNAAYKNWNELELLNSLA